jgi:phosphatidylethanolamine-binding protein (PEBP) family uncharacterized protein
MKGTKKNNKRSKHKRSKHKQSNKRSRHKQSNKRSKHKHIRRRKQTGGSIANIIRLGGAIIEHMAQLKISYGNTLLQPNEDLTGKTTLYKQKPTINFNPHKDKTYLITMTDPDAPNGVGKQTWAHYVVLMNNNVAQEFYPYKPPTPPANSGIHRYIFSAYAYKEYEPEKLINKNLAGNVYYKQILEPIIKNKDAMTTFQFTVST